MEKNSSSLFSDCCAVLLWGGKSRRMGRDKALLPWGEGTFLQAIASQMECFPVKYLSVSGDRRSEKPPLHAGQTEKEQEASSHTGSSTKDLEPSLHAGQAAKNPETPLLAGQMKKAHGTHPADHGLSGDWIILPDIIPDCGPVGGIHAALSVCGTEWALVCSCDLPAVEEGLFRCLLESREAGSQIVCPVTPDGRFHLTCALYHRSILPVLENRIAEGDYRLRSLLACCSVTKVPVESPASADACRNQEVMPDNINTPDDYDRLMKKTADEKHCLSLRGRESGTLQPMKSRVFPDDKKS